jgi:ribosomal protein L12E/L44/L45/RPP1/RPP2
MRNYLSWPIRPYWLFPFLKHKRRFTLKKILAALVAGAFAIASVGAFAAAHTAAAPAKDGKKDEMKKDEAKKDGKKDEMKKDSKKDETKK